jgi:hypothetical protein
LCPDCNIIVMKILSSYLNTVAPGTTIASLIKRRGELGFYFRKNRQSQSLPAMFRVVLGRIFGYKWGKGAGKLVKSA